MLAQASARPRRADSASSDPERRKPAQDRREVAPATAFKAPSLPLNRPRQSEMICGNMKGSAHMRPSKMTRTEMTSPKVNCAMARGGFLGLALILGWALAGFLAGWCGSAQAQGAVRSVHGDWQIRCDTPPGAQSEQCALIQSVVAEDRSNAGLTVIVLKTADQKSRLMRVVAPLGVLLPSGLGLKLDNQDVGRAGFVRCLPNGCVAEVVMDEKLLGQLKNAKTATFIIFETPEEGIGFPLSLNGLSDGFDKLP
jgi:invasion protein IalB